MKSIVVSLEEAADRDTQYLLNLVVASGYVAEDADLTFRENRAGGYLYTYFNIQPLEDEAPAQKTAAYAAFFISCIALA